MMAEEKLRPVHPGEVLLEEFLKPMGLSQNSVALSMGVPARRINEIVLGKRRITGDALPSCRQFGSRGEVVEIDGNIVVGYQYGFYGVFDYLSLLGSREMGPQRVQFLSFA